MDCCVTWITSLKSTFETCRIQPAEEHWYYAVDSAENGSDAWLTQPTITPPTKSMAYICYIKHKHFIRMSPSFVLNIWYSSPTLTYMQVQVAKIFVWYEGRWIIQGLFNNAKKWGGDSKPWQWKLLSLAAWKLLSQIQNTPYVLPCLFLIGSHTYICTSSCTYIGQYIYLITEQSRENANLFICFSHKLEVPWMHPE